MLVSCTTSSIDNSEQNSLSLDVPSGSLPAVKSPGGVTKFGTDEFFPYAMGIEPLRFPLSCIGVAWTLIFKFC